MYNMSKPPEVKVLALEGSAKEVGQAHGSELRPIIQKGNQPLGLCANTLLELAGSKDGLPVAFVVRGILKQPNLDKATDFIKKVKHASGQNYILGDAEKIVDLECSANKVSRYVPPEGDRRTCHANHALANDEKRRSAEEINN
jgi:predicted choloylglycine hydrolase